MWLQETATLSRTFYMLSTHKIHPFPQRPWCWVFILLFISNHWTPASWKPLYHMLQTAEGSLKFSAPCCLLIPVFISSEIFKSLNCIKHMQIDGRLLKCRCLYAANPRWKDRGRGSRSSGSVILLVVLTPNTAACTPTASFDMTYLPNAHLAFLASAGYFNEWSLGH